MAAVPTGSRSVRVRDVLLQRIHVGAFPEGRLPPEKQLAEELGVSRTTLRSALAGLEDDGLITRRRRHGTVVNQHLLRTAMRLNRLVAFTDLIEQCGHTPSVDPQQLWDEPAGALVAERLGIAEDAPCLVAARLLRAGGAPVIAVRDVVPRTRLASGTDVPQASSTFAFLEGSGVGRVAYAATELAPRVAAEGVPAGLQLAAGTPYLELLETHYSPQDEPVALSRVAVDDSLVRLSLLRRA